MSNTNYTEAQRVDRSRFLQHFDNLMKGSDFRPMAADLIMEVCEKYGLPPQPTPNKEEGKVLRWVKASERNPTTHGLYHCNVEINHFGEWVKGKNSIGFYNGKWLRGEVYRVISWLEETTPETSSPAVQPDLLSEMRDKAIQDGFDDLCLKHGPYKGECIECAREETRLMASESGMRQDDFDRQTRIGMDIATGKDEIVYLRVQNGVVTPISKEEFDSHKPPEPAPIKQGEIPEEIMEWIKQYQLQKLPFEEPDGSKYTSSANATILDKRRLCQHIILSFYHKMQEEITLIKKERDILIGNDKRQEEKIAAQREEIQEYRRAMEDMAATLPPSSIRRKQIQILLEKYPH